MNALQTITDDVYSVRESFAAISSAGAANFEREAQFAIQCISASDYAMKIGMSNRQSVINAVTNIAAIGISLNPAKKQAYLVPRDGKICLEISYMGLLDIAIESGSLRWGQAELVRDGEAFQLNGFDKPPTHNRDPFAKDRGDVVGVYVVVKTADGDYLTTTMTIEEVNAIRDRSSAWKAYVKDKRSCPWVTDPGEMIKKTVIKRAYKTWPKTERLETAVHYLNTEGGEGLSDIEAPNQHDPKKGAGSISATEGAMERLDLETQNYLREVGEDVVSIFEEKGAAEAFDRIAIEGLDPDQGAALWAVLKPHSKIRTALKKEGESRKGKKAA